MVFWAVSSKILKLLCLQSLSVLYFYGVSPVTDGYWSAVPIWASISWVHFSLKADPSLLPGWAFSDLQHKVLVHLWRYARMTTSPGILLGLTLTCHSLHLKILFLFCRKIPARLFFILDYQALWFFSCHFSPGFYLLFLLAYVEVQLGWCGGERSVIQTHSASEQTWLDSTEGWKK